MIFELKKHQIEAANKAEAILRALSLVYIAGQPRVGKSLIALELTRRLKPKATGRVLVLTKKMAINDWLKYQGQFEFDIANYEKAKKLQATDYNFIIVDEAHNFNAFPKPSQRIKDVRQLCKGKPVILLSGTPFIENPNGAYSQFSLSSFSPFSKFKNGYDYWRTYGQSALFWLNGRQVESYKGCNTTKLFGVLAKYTVKVSYEDAGFTYQNYDEIVRLEPGDDLLEMLKYMRDNQMATAFSETEYPLESISAECQAAHRFTGGFYEDLNLPSPKLDWLLDFVEEHSGRIAIMCYFIEEQEWLTERFIANENVTVLSSTKYCEGIDLSHFDHYILYSFGYSGAKFVQLRDRIVNLDKLRETRVVIPLLEGCIDEAIYETVSDKKTFNARLYLNSRMELDEE